MSKSESSNSGITALRVSSTELENCELLAQMVNDCISNSIIGAPLIVPSA